MPNRVSSFVLRISLHRDATQFDPGHVRSDTTSAHATVAEPQRRDFGQYDVTVRNDVKRVQLIEGQIRNHFHLQQSEEHCE